MPESWNLDDEKATLSDSAFSLNYLFTYGSQLMLYYNYKTRRDAVPVELAEAHVQNLKRARAKIGREIFNYVGAKSDRLATWAWFVLGGFILAGVALLPKVLRHSAHPQQVDTSQFHATEAPPLHEGSYRRLGGVLILLGIILGLSPLVLLFNIGKSLLPSLMQTTWSRLTTSGSESYHPLWAPALIFELMGNLALLALALVTAIYFFRRRKLAVKLVMIFLISNFALQLLDAILTSFIPDVARSRTNLAAMSGTVRAAVSCAIWIPYLFLSKRVKGTFVQ